MTFDISTYKVIYDEGKFFVGIGGIMWSIVKGVQWVRAIRENDLRQIHDGVTDLRSEVEKQTLGITTHLEKQTNTFITQLDKQTNAFVSELRELRADIRILYTPVPTLINRRTAKAKKTKKIAKKSLTSLAAKSII